MKAFSIDDLYLHHKISELHCLPNSPSAVAAVRSVDRENDCYRSHLYLFPIEGGAPRPLTRGAWLDTSPRLCPTSGRIAFVSARGTDAPQLQLIDVDGGEAWACGELPGGVSSLRWMPDGRHLLTVGTVAVDPDRRGRRGPSPSTQGPAEVCWRLPYKADGVGYVLDRELHLFIVDVESGSHRQLTDGPFDVMGFEASPDGKRIAQVRSREGLFGHCSDLWVSDADGGNSRRLTHELATVLQPTWSPDGRHIAFAGTAEEGSGQSHPYLYDSAECRLKRLGDDALEVAPVSNAVQWHPAGDRLLVARSHRGCHELVSLAPSGHDMRTLLAGDRQMGAFGCTGNALAFIDEHPTRPSELRAVDIDGGDERALSDLNPWWRDRTPLRAEKRGFEVPDGRGGRETVEGWLIRDPNANEPQPLLDDVHGGPGSHALLDFDTNVYWQVLCSRGWVVLALNAVGSSSYGREFCSRLAGHWGEMDLPQHEEAVRQLQEEGVADSRVAICGKSYGGFMSAWAVGHTTLFRASIVMAPVGNIETHYGTSDGGYYADPFYMATAPHFDRRLARALSPLQKIESATTPTLFLQGKDDERCPKCQSEEMFVSLCRAGGAPTELVLYPGQNHHFLGEGRPACRADAAGRIVDWLTRHAVESAARPVVSDRSTARAVTREPAPIDP